ncbi:MAG: hypothetical protein ACREKE_02770, partial [bacterium]
ALILLLALGLAQAWTIWYLRREVARIEFRLGEALDDEDLLEFQERLGALLAEAKSSAERLAKSSEAQRLGLDVALEKARLAEKRLALRLVAGSAAEAGRRSTAPTSVSKARRPDSDGAAGATNKPKVEPKAKPQAKTQDAAPPRTPGSQKMSVSSKPVAPEKSQSTSGALGGGEAPEIAGEAERDERRSYLVRPRETSVSRNQAVYDLADQGLDIDAIARRSGLLAGEVDLILSLRQR